jgi:RNA polymerase sigma factor (sigma-70 family)
VTEEKQMNQLLAITNELETVLPSERARLVKLCATITGNAGIAEDLAQETLLEAWRHIHELRDPQRRTQWLSGIARNVCLRWARKQGRDLAHLTGARPHEETMLAGLEDELAGDLDLEVELERKELVELLDRALALLPPEMRTILVKRYVEESPIAEVAAQLGINTMAAAMRLQRGKLALRRVLTCEFGQELAPYGIHSSAAEQWEETRLWCPYCGQRRLLGQFLPNNGGLLLRCPACNVGTDGNMVNNHKAALFGYAKTYKPALSRLLVWGEAYYYPNLLTRTAPCLHCGRPTTLRLNPSVDAPAWVQAEHGDRRGIYNECKCRDAQNWASLDFLVLCLPQGRRFLREHPRTREFPTYETETDGRSSIVTRFESVTGPARFEVVSALDTFEAIRINGERP